MALVALISPSLLAQDGIFRVHADNDYRTALELLDKKHLGASRVAFERYIASGQSDIKVEDAEYFIALTALSLFHQDGEYRIDQFANENPEHPKSAVANYELGSFYYREKNYQKGAEYLAKVDFSEMSTKQGNQGRFKLGYSLFALKKFEEAVSYFNQLKRSDNEFYSASNYYAGYIEYRNKQYDLALADLQKAEKGEAYIKVVPFMIASVYYKQGRYPELINYAEKIKAKNPETKSHAEVSLMVADAYYKSKDYERASEYFDLYLLDNKATSNNEVLYRMAFSQYKSSRNGVAIDNFKKVALGNDSLGQNASYYLGLLYMEEENPMFALPAFEKASKLGFYPKMQEEAAYNRGKILYDLGKYSEAIVAFKDFKKKYTTSSYNAELDDLISEAYLNDNNRDEAMKYIESLPNKSAKAQKAYQQLAFYKAVELFNNTRYFEAVKMFEKSNQYPIDNNWLSQSYFWMAEAYSIGKKYQEAINAYAAVFRTTQPDNETYLKARYGIAYAYYNTQEYSKALVHFKEYVTVLKQRSNKLFYQDALIRLADCYYVNKLYGQALEQYENAIQANHPDKDYAWFQKGVIQNLQNNPEAAKASLDQVLKKFPDSRYLDDAEFQRAQIDFERGAYAQAVAGFSQLIDHQKQSPFIPYALTKRAIANFNLQQYPKTEADYKTVLNEYVTHKTANGALLGLQEVLSLQNRSDEFAPYLANYKKTNPENSGLVSVEFETAKNLYFNQKYDKAIGAFNEFLKNYGETAQAFEARYYLAESYNRQNDLPNAIAFFTEVVNENQTPFISRSIQRIAELQYKQSNYHEAIIYFNRLLQVAGNKKEQYNAWSGLMESYFMLASHDSVHYYANIILEKGNVSANAQNKAYVFLGKSAWQKGDYESATDYFLNALNSSRDEFGAEAQYYIALIYHQQKLYNQSLQACFELRDKFGIYENWLGKGFLLIADNFVATGETFQAEATLKSIIEKSPDKSVVSEAQLKLKSLEGKKNTSGKTIVQDSIKN